MEAKFAKPLTKCCCVNSGSTWKGIHDEGKGFKALLAGKKCVS